jgi:hypothetical protein
MTNPNLTREQFCARQHIHKRTEARLRDSGEGPPFVRVGPRLILYPLAGVEEWEASRTYRSRADELSRKAG